jgi:2-oxoglutarate ferredoxin oxidoreductase subunit alpha
MAMYGRHGDAPLPIVAAQTPGDCFRSAFEAVQIAIERRTPVILLTDGFLANSSEPWRIPALDELPEIDPGFAVAPPEGERFLPYARDERGVRPWAPPGTPGLEHRIGGIEKQDGTGNISYDPANHAHMTRVRAAKVANIAADLPPLAVDDPDGDADVLVIGWGSTYGSIRAGVRRVRDRGLKVAQAHVRYINPLPANIGEVLRSYDKVLVPEMNTGQLVKLLRAEFLVDAKPYNKITGQPLYAAELEEAIVELLEAPSEVPA